MELKEARYILAIAKHQSIGKAAESLYISQPSLSKYLKNLEERLGAPLFDRRENHYYPTYMGERYLYYAERIAAFGDQWSQEFDDIAHQEKGRLNIAAPIMMGTTLIEPSLMGFHKRYPYVTLNIMEAINFVAENSLEDNSIDLTIYNVHKFPENMDYQILREEEIVLVLNKNHPLCEKAQPKEGFRHPWLDLKMLEKENFILLYPDQNTGGIAQSLFKEYSMEPTVLLHTRNSAMSIRLAIQGLGRIPFFPGRMLLLHWPETGSYHNHCSIPEKEIPFPACKRLCGDLKRICYFPIGFKGQRYIKNILNKMIYLIFFLYRSMRRMPL